MADQTSKPAKPPPRVIVRLGLFLVAHSNVVSVLCCIAGFVTLLLLPVLAKNTYISENALMPGSANPMYGARDAAEANNLVRNLLALQVVPGDPSRDFAKVIANHMQDVGAEVYYHHNFHSGENQFHPVRFFSGMNFFGRQENVTCVSWGLNSIGILRAPQGDGKEAIVLVTTYNSTGIDRSGILSLGLAYSVFSLLSRVDWLAKDIVWLAADSRYGEYNAVASWLRDYHNPTFLNGYGPVTCEMGMPLNKRELGIFKRAGTMAAALVLKVTGKERKIKSDVLKIYAEASNGQMPNLDLINIVNYLAIHRQGFHVEVASSYLLKNTKWLKAVGDVLEWINKIAVSLNPQWGFGISSSEYIDGIATLASSIFYQALGIPTGSHGAFRDYQVDAITLEMSPEVSVNKDIGLVGFLLKGGRLVEGAVRSVNNLLEKFHQSFFLYFLTSPGKFVSVGVYMIAFALLIIPLPVVSAALYSHSKQRGICVAAGLKSSDGYAVLQPELESWKWLHAAKVVFVMHLWAAIVSLLPYLIYQMPHGTSTIYLLAWLLISVIILLVLNLIFGSPFYGAGSLIRSQSHIADWAILKSVTIAAASIGLCIMSIINFATAQLGAILVVVMCLTICPVKHILGKPLAKGCPLLALNLAVIIVGFPPILLLIGRGLYEGFVDINFGYFWDWTESLWSWDSATYLYLTLVHLPSWLLCAHILLHPL